MRLLVFIVITISQETQQRAEEIGDNVDKVGAKHINMAILWNGARTIPITAHVKVRFWVWSGSDMDSIALTVHHVTLGTPREEVDTAVS